MTTTINVRSRFTLLPAALAALTLSAIAPIDKALAHNAPAPSADDDLATPAATPAPVVGAVPVAISILDAQVDASVEQIEIVDGQMQDPTGPWVVSWYKESPKLGAQGNTLLAGHKDYWGVGPSIFYTIGDLQPGDLITVTGDNGKVYTYKVQWVRVYDTATAPLQEIVGPTKSRALTLITCGGDFDTASGEYLSRTVVRARYAGSSTPKK